MIDSVSKIDPPYPSDIEAKGWSLDLDYERIEQSDTWAIASSEQRPWLLMLWLVSWRQVPAASLPNNHKLIAARLGMPLEKFTEWADVLLSGWELATDGRLYHKTLTNHVLSMANKRNKDRARVANFRAKSQDTNADVDACNALHTRDQHVSSTPTPTPTPTINTLPPDGGCPQQAADPLPCPHSEILKLWQTRLPNLTQPRSWEGSRRANLKSRWLQAAKPSAYSDGYKTPEEGIEWWGKFFGYIANHTTLADGFETKGRSWKPDLEWVVNAANFQKIVDEKYAK
jgi:hypothetical protein